MVMLDHGHLPHLQSWKNQPIVFLTCTIADRRHLLDNDSIHNVIRGIWEKSFLLNGWAVGHYVLMPDHIHLFARATVSAISLSEWVGLWKSLSARFIRKQMKVKMPLWQAEYFDRFLRSSDSYANKWQYMFLNPERAGLVTNAEDWKYRGVIIDLTDVGISH